MISFLKRKKIKVEKEKTTEEILYEIEEKYEKERVKMIHEYDRKNRELKESYENKLDEERNFERDFDLQKILKEAENGTNPLEYSITTGSERYKEAVFIRGKQSPNPYVITVEEHKNCIFLSVTKGRKERVGNSLLVLYYDKIKNVYQEYKWELNYDYVVKHQLRMFLYNLIEHVRKDELHNCSFYISEFKARNIFWEKEHAWMKEYEEKAHMITSEKERKLQELKIKYNQETAPYQKLRREKTEREEKEKAKEEEEKFRQKDIVFDRTVEEKMNEIYHYTYDLFQKKYLLQIENAYQLESLYHRDIQELWQGYITLDQKKQEQEKNRFMELLTGIENHLYAFEEKMKDTEALGYEKKMMVMEKRYLKEQ